MDKTGGPAFPRKGVRVLIPKELEDNPYVEKIEYFEDGMTLRDWMAGMALQGITANNDHVLNLPGDYGKDNNLPYTESVAKIAYAYADAMLKERERE